MKSNKSAYIALAMLGMAFSMHAASPVVAAGYRAGIPGASPVELRPEIVRNRYDMAPVDRALESRSLASGLTETVMIAADGSTYKTYSAPGGEGLVSRHPGMRLVRRAETATSLQESFEDFQSKPAGWLPEGWSLKSTAPATYGWRVTDANGEFRPTNGQYQAFIPFAPTDAGTEQNEWLISPEFIPAAGSRLYADITASLFSIYDPQYFDAGTLEFSKRKVTATLSVKVLCDGQWSEVFNVRDLAARLEDAELYERHAAPEAHTARISLDNFAGKPIRVAFVYAGAGGNSMAVDYISVGQPNNMAIYHRPRGFFFEGIGVNWSTDENFAPMVGPAYTDATWYSLYTRDVESVKWTFTDPYDYSAVVESTELTASMRYPYTIAYAPEITAYSDGIQPLTYQFDVANSVDGIVKYGGGGIDWDDDDNIMEYGCGAYNWRCGLQAPVFADEPGAYLFGPTSNKRFWSTGGVQLLSIAGFYDKPLSPYVFDKVWLNIADIDADDDTPLTLNVYTIGEDGKFNPTPVASSTIMAKDIIRYNTQDGGHLYTVVFDFDIQTVDSAILLEFTGFMDSEKVRVFSPLCQNTPHVDGENNGYLFCTDGRETKLIPSSTMLSNFFCPFIMTLNATYPFLVADETLYLSPAEGGSHDFKIISYYDPSAWEIDGDIPDWIVNLEPMETVDEDGGYHTALRVETAALPSGLTGRTWTFRLVAPGCSKHFTVNQGEVASVDPVMTGAERTGSVYDLNGHCLGTCTVDALGHPVGLPAMQKGVVVVKFDNGETLKVII